MNDFGIATFPSENMQGRALGYSRLSACDLSAGRAGASGDPVSLDLPVGHRRPRMLLSRACPGMYEATEAEESIMGLK